MGKLSVTGHSRSRRRHAELGILIPTQILGSKLMAWYDGTDPNGNGTLPSNNTEVTPWKDKSGNGRDVDRNGIVGTGAEFFTNQINGRGILRFDGLADGYFRSGVFMYANGGIEVWFVAKSNESGLGAIVSEGRTDTANLAYRIYDDETNNDYVFNLENSSGTTRFANTQDRSTNDWDLTICRDSGAATGTSVEVVGVDSGTTGAYTRDSVTMTAFSVGYCQRNNKSLFFDGDMADILILSSPATTTERALLAAYFNAKYAKTWAPV